MDEKDKSVDFFFYPSVSEEEVAREKRKARELRASQWWKNRKASGICHYCKKELPPRELTMDHLVPLIRGGKTSKSNVVPCCAECNARKKYMLPIEWAEYMDSLDKS
jgi:5-methylcytosine-specific restriction endonuclease McrA